MPCDHYFVRRRQRAPGPQDARMPCGRPDEYDCIPEEWQVIPMFQGYGFPQILPGSPNYPPPDPEPEINFDDLLELLWGSKYDGNTVSAIMAHLLSDVPIGELAKQYGLKARSLSVACSRTKCDLGFPRR